MQSCIRILVTDRANQSRVLFLANYSVVHPCRNYLCDRLDTRNYTNHYRQHHDVEFSHKVLRGGYSCTWLYVSLILPAGIYYILGNNKNSAIIATIARFPYLFVLTTLDENVETLLATTKLIIWTHVEMVMALIASSAATFRPIITLLQISAWQDAYR